MHDSPRRILVAMVALAASFALGGCYRSHQREPWPDAGPPRDGPTCLGAAPTCVAPGADACATPVLVASSCDAATARYACPPGSRVHVHVRATSTSECLPFSDPSLGLSYVVGSLARVPTPDGRCLWIAESVTTGEGRELSNVAFETPRDAPFGACPMSATPFGGSLRSAVTLEGDDGTQLVQITGGFTRRGVTTVVYRLFVFDASGGFGVRELGTGLARWDVDRETIIVPRASGVLWPPEIDLGDAIYAEGDAAYLWGCPPPITDLVERCLVARVDLSGATFYWATDGWTPTWLGERTGFDAGPWLSSVTRLGADYAAITAIGFGSDLRVARTASVTSGWSAATNLARCRLPSGDVAAYCAGPVVHDELRDPLRPRELPISYGIGTTAADGAELRLTRPRDYWTRLDWVAVP